MTPTGTSGFGAATHGAPGSVASPQVIGSAHVATTPTTPTTPTGQPSTFTGGASGGVDAQADLDPNALRRAATDQPRNMSNDLGHAQGEVGPEAGEARLSGAAGASGTSVASGGAVSFGEQKTAGVGQLDMSTRGADEMHSQDLEARRRMDKARDATRQDPSAHVGRAEELELNERDEALGRVSHAQDRADHARVVAADPKAAATAHASATATAEATSQSGVDPNQVRSDVTSAQSVANNPRGVAEARADLAIDEKEDEVRVDAGLSSSAKTKPPEPKK
ncbi:MAG TPA: hypothetical protein VFQ53_11660 [Kofleriaceae bacterium]|nr:hypothetical protein [Kofleriaceae bacterium]